jgi:hypothetical protein
MTALGLKMTSWRRVELALGGGGGIFFSKDAALPEDDDDYDEGKIGSRGFGLLDLGYKPSGRGLSSFTFQLKLSAFCAIGGAFRG